MTQLVTSLSKLLARDLLYESVSRQQKPDGSDAAAAASTPATAATPDSSVAAAKETPESQEAAQPPGEAAQAIVPEVEGLQDEQSEEKDEVPELPIAKEDRISFSSHAKLRSSIVAESSLLPEALAQVEQIDANFERWKGMLEG